LKEKACGEAESHFRPFSSLFAELKKRVTDGRTHRRMDGPTTDKTSYRDAWTHLKKKDPSGKGKDTCFLRYDLPSFFRVLIRESSKIIDGRKRITQGIKILKRQAKKISRQ